MRDFTICSNTNKLGLQSNAIKDMWPLILHQLVVGWMDKHVKFMFSKMQKWENVADFELYINL